MPPSSMSQGDNGSRTTSIVVSPVTLAKVRAQKTAGESYDELLPRMCEQYTPPDPPEAME